MTCNSIGRSSFALPTTKGAILLAAMLWCGTSAGQSLRGFVTDAGDGTPLELVHVILRTADGSVVGSVTDLDGSYLVPDLRMGLYTVTARRVGFEVFSDSIYLESGRSEILNIELTAGVALEEVVIESEGAQSSVGFVAVRPRDIARIPMPDLTGDLAGYLSAMPGVVALADQGGQVFIRGGEPTQNLVQVDGVMVYQPMHILGFYSAFPSDIISGSDVYAGGFGAGFGERMSSVIDVSARTGSMKGLAGTATVSPFISSLTLEGPVVRDRLSVLASARQSMVDGGASRIIGRELPLRFGDAFLKMSGNVSNSSRASLIAMRTYDQGTLHEGPNPDEVRWSNLSAGLRYLVLPRRYPLSADVRVSHSRLESELGSRDKPSRETHIENWHFAWQATFYGRRADVETGMALRVVSSGSVLGGQFQNTDVSSQDAEHVSVHVEPEFKLGPRTRLRTGVRVQFFDMRFAPYLEPRWRLDWQFGRHQISSAGGLYYQAVLGINDRRDAASVFTVWTSAPKRQSDRNDVRAGIAQQALHGLFGYRIWIGNALQIAAEAYHKRLRNLYIAEWTAYPRFTTRLQPAAGRVLGVDVRLEMKHRSLQCQVSYGYAATRYEAMQETLGLWYGEESVAFNPPHDRRHQIGALASATVRGFDVSTRFSFGSGLPFSRAVGFDGFLVVDDVEGLAEKAGSRRVIYERPFEARLPTYHRMDIAVARAFSAGEANIAMQLSAINTYDRRNLFYLDVFTLQRTDQLPFIPSMGIKVTY